MRAFTDSDSVFGFNGAATAGSTSAAPANGVSLDTAKYEDIVASVSAKIATAGAISASVQFYQSDVASGAISGWAAVGAPVVVDLGAVGAAGISGNAVKNRQEFTKKYASAIATVTHPAAGAGDVVSLVLGGRIVSRVNAG